MNQHTIDVDDRSGKSSQITVWNHPSDDIWGMVSRSRRIVDAMELMLGGEVYHYHSKLLLKKPEVGGAWEWHQDYGDWYQNGCLYAYLASCWIALDPANIKAMAACKSSRDRISLAVSIMASMQVRPVRTPNGLSRSLSTSEVAYCELDPGSAPFFHSNSLHRSDANTSDRTRWNLICCCNAARNNPYKEHPHPQYTPLEKAPDTAIKEMTASSESFYKPDEASKTRGHTAR